MDAETSPWDPRLFREIDILREHTPAHVWSFDQFVVIAVEGKFIQHLFIDILFITPITIFVGISSKSILIAEPLNSLGFIFFRKLDTKILWYLR